MSHKKLTFGIIGLGVLSLGLIVLLVVQHTTKKTDRYQDISQIVELSNDLEAQLILSDLSGLEAETLIRQLIALLLVRIQQLEDDRETNTVTESTSHDGSGNNSSENEVADEPASDIIFEDTLDGVSDESTDDIVDDTSNEAGQTSRFSDDFESVLVFDALTAWKQKQLVRGTVERVADPLNPSNTVAKAIAGAVIGSQVGKSDLIKKYEPIPVGSSVIVTADFYFPDDNPLDKIFLMDIECDSCGVEKTPGVRLYVRDGYLEVERGKIGFDDDFASDKSQRLTTGEWHTITFAIEIGETNGRSQVQLNGTTIIDERGINIISQSVLDQYGVTLAAQHIDSIQVGLTANGNNSSQSLYIDNVEIAVE